MSQFALPDSPVKTQLLELIEQAKAYHLEATEDALYLAFTKRICQRAYSGDKQQYLLLIIEDLEQAKREFNEVAYANQQVEQVFAMLKQGVLAALVS